MQVCGRKAGCYLLPHGGFVCWQAQTGHNGLAALAQQKQVAQVARQFAHKKADVHALLQNLRAEVCYGGAVLPVQGGKQLGKKFLPSKAQHLPRGGHGQFLAAQGEGLIEQRHAVAHAACGAAGDKAHRPFFKGGVFLAQHGGKVRIQCLFAQMSEHKVLAAAHNGDGKLVRLCGGKDKDHALRRLFQRLQQGVEGVAGEHVGFVDDKNLVAAFHGRVADGFAQRAGIFNAVVGSAVDFRHVHVYALGDLAALLALVAGLWPRRVLAVERLGKNTCNGGFAHAARAAQ